MSVWQAALLGLVQGIGEFLPISSSGHLVLLSWFTHVPYQGLAFDVALHVGTLLAIVIFFWKDWWRLVIAGLSKGTRTVDGRLFWYLVAASVPAAVLGVALGDKVDTVLRDPLIIGIMLIVMGLVLYAADVYGSKRKPLSKTSFLDSMFIGFMQALALIPGTSRSGATITGGLFSGLTREAAARFSFLLSAPAILGAAVIELPKLAGEGIGAPVVVGAVVAAASGLLAIGFLLKYLKRNGFLIFVVYRVALGLVVIGMRLTR